MEKLDKALGQGRGILFVTGHYGGIEYIPIFLALKGYPMSVIAKFSTKQLKEATYHDQPHTEENRGRGCFRGSPQVQLAEIQIDYREL